MSCRDIYYEEMLYHSSTPTQLDVTPLPPLADCGASMTFLNESDIALVSNYRKDDNIIVEYPNSTTATSIGSGLYRPAPGIPPSLLRCLRTQTYKDPLLD